MPSLVRTLGIRSSVASPIVVDGALWGAITAASVEDPLPSSAERRLTEFTELVATAVANTHAREEVTALADQQAALRRVATLVAEGAPPDALFSAVADEVASVVGVPTVTLCHHHGDGSFTVVAATNNPGFPVGSRWPLDGPSLAATIHATGRAARIDDYSDFGGAVAAAVRDSSIRAAAGAPIVVDGKVWGHISVAAKGAEPLPVATEQRLHDFTELLATAISNATAREDLVASRARIVATGDEARRRIERNLHDGTQQRLIALGLDLQGVRAGIPDDQPETQSALVAVEQDLETILADLRELSHGLHPQLLSRLGLGPSLQALARRSPIPVHLDVDLPERPAASLETAMYYVVSEALTNAIKHSHASGISVTITSGEKLRASIVDDGVGDADPSDGSGLTGLLDRVDALGGRFALESPPRGGTRISIELPVEPPVAS
jgi:signal transduction histidine kinase